MRYLFIMIVILYLSLQFKGGNREFESRKYDPITIDIVKLGAPPIHHQVYEYIKMYSKQYNVPLRYVLNCARLETGYKGKNHFNYKHYQVSEADAYGVLQVQVPTANDMWNNRTITANDLRYNIKLNIETGIKYQRWLMDDYLKDKYKKWIYVFTAYNKGISKGRYKEVNKYAKIIVGNNV